MKINDRWKIPNSPKKNNFKYRSRRDYKAKNSTHKKNRLQGTTIGELNIASVIENQKSKKDNTSLEKKMDKQQKKNNLKVLSSNKKKQEENYFLSKTDKSIKKSILSQYQYYSDEDTSYHDDDYYDDDPSERDLIDKILEQQSGD